MSSIKIIFFFLLVSFQLSAQEKKWTLKECVDHAIQNNISVKSSELDLKNVALNKKDAIGNFMPNVSASASHSWNIGLNQNITTGLLQNQTTQFTSAGLNANVDLFKGLQNQNQLRKANLSLIASQYQLLKIQEDVALNVANAYLQILFNKEALKVQEQQVDYNKTQLQRTTDLVEAGVVPRGDLLDIKATVASDTQRLIVAKNTLLISKLSLAQLLRLDDFENFDVSDDEISVSESEVLLESSENIVAKAKENRTELKIAESNIAIAKKDISIARGAYLPTLTAFYSYSTRASYSDRIVGIQPNATNPTSVIGYVNDGSGTTVLQDNYSAVLGKALPVFEQFDNNKGQNFGLQLSMPVFNGFSIRNNVQRTKIAYEKAQLNYDQTELDLERNVFVAYTDTKGAQESYTAAQITLEARELSFNYAKERYDVGLMNVFDFNQAQTLLVNAQSEALRTKYDYIFRTKILEFYFGIPLIEKQ
jgi:outer membrane protein